MGNIQIVIFNVYNFYTHGCDVFTCKNVFYTHWYHFYIHGCDVFTCKNVLYTRSYIFFSHGHGWNVFIHARTFFPLTDTTSFPMASMYLHERYSVHSLICLLFLWVKCIYASKNAFLHSLIGSYTYCGQQFLPW